MKILLVYPPTNEKVIGRDLVFIHEPLSLEYLASAVRENHDVQILDMRISDLLLETLEEYRPHIVGTTGFTVHVNSCIEICTAVKEHNEKALTVVGGAHATALPQDFHHESIDVIVSGEGVFPFREITERFEEGRDLKGINGTSVRDSHSYSKTIPAPHPGLDALPFPDRSLTGAYRSSYFTPLLKPLASIKSSIGCAYRCNYCMLWKITGGRYLPRDPQRIVEELATIEEPNVFFADDDTLMDPQRMILLAEAILSRGIEKQYQINGRPDSIASRPDVIAKWREIGLMSVVIGFESFRDNDLCYFNRDTTVSMNEKALQILRSHGVIPIGYFIVRPDYCREDFRNLRKYIRRLNLENLIFTVLTPLPGTDFFEDTKSQIIVKDYDLYDFRHTVLPTRLAPKEFYKELAGLFEGSVSRWKGVTRLLQQPLKDMIPHHLRSKRILKQVRDAYHDH